MPKRKKLTDADVKKVESVILSDTDVEKADRSKYGVARRSIWYILRFVLIASVVVTLCYAALMEAMYVSNIYIIVTEGMEMRADCILGNKSKAELTEHFTESWLQEDEAVNGSIRYIEWIHMITGWKSKSSGFGRGQKRQRCRSLSVFRTFRQLLTAAIQPTRFQAGLRAATKSLSISLTGDGTLQGLPLLMSIRRRSPTQHRTIPNLRRIFRTIDSVPPPYFERRIVNDDLGGALCAALLIWRNEF